MDMALYEENKLYEIKYYFIVMTYNFLKIIVMIIINYYYIIYNELNYFSCECSK